MESDKLIMELLQCQLPLLKCLDLDVLYVTVLTQLLILTPVTLISHLITLSAFGQVSLTWGCLLHYKHGSHVFVCFIDFSKALARVNYWKLFYQLLDDGCDVAIIGRL